VNDLIDALVAALPDLRSGLLITLQLTIGGAVGGFLIAVGLGLWVRSRSMLVRSPARFLIEFFRGTSLMVQLFWFFYVMPLFGLELGGLTCGVLALALNYGAYGAEVVRGSIEAVPKGQWEARIALSMSPAHHLTKVIWPQAWAIMIPSLANLAIMLLKGTAVAYIILMHDITFETEKLRQATGNTFFAYGVGMAMYLVIALVIVGLARLAERHAKARLGGATPLFSAARRRRVAAGSGVG